MKKVNIFLSLILESETHILYRCIPHSEIFEAFISLNVDYGVQIMKTQNSVLEYYIRSIKKGYFKQ